MTRSSLAMVLLAALAIGAPAAKAVVPPDYGILGIPYGGTGGGDVPSARANLGATSGGVQLDASADLGLTCDEVADSSASFVTALTQYKATTTPVTFNFNGPKKCLIDPAIVGNQTISGLLNFRFTNGGGFLLKAGSVLNGYPLSFTANSGNVTFTGAKVDMNGATFNAVPSGFAHFTGNAKWIVGYNEVINAGPVNSGQGAFILDFSAIQDAEIIGNVVKFQNPSTESNRGIVVRQNSGLVRVLQNSVYNSGTVAWNFTGTVLMANNYSTNSNYGSLFAMEPTLSTDSATKRSEFVNNVGYLSGTSADVAGDIPGGVEIGYNGVLVQGNLFSGTGGECIRVYGWASVLDNVCIGWGRANIGTVNNSAYSASITSIMPTGANHSYFNGNKAYDDGSVAGTHSEYGYTDFSNTADVTLGVNDFQGTQGAYRIIGGTQFASPQVDNRVGNPCFAVDQANAGGTFAFGNGPDRWTAQNSRSDSTFSMVGHTAQMGECPNSLQVTVGAQTTPGAGDIAVIRQAIPLGDVRDFGFGSAQAKTLVHSFCVKMSVTPFTGSAYLQNMVSSPFTWVYQWTYNSAANQRQCFSHVINADTVNGLAAGATGNVGMYWGIDLGTGASGKTATVNAWTAGQKYGATASAAFSALANGTTMNISNARLLPAAADEGWSPRTFDSELWDAQRFYQTSFAIGTAPAQNAGLGGAVTMISPVATSLLSQNISLRRNMRSAPTVTLFNPSAANGNCFDTTASADVAAATSGVSPSRFLLKTTATVAGAGDNVACHFVADSRF